MSIRGITHIIAEMQERLDRIPDSDAVTLDKSIVRALLNALPSPDAENLHGSPDDLHTALARVIAGSEETDAPVLVDADHIADAILASRAVSVRLRGTVTEEATDV